MRSILLGVGLGLALVGCAGRGEPSEEAASQASAIIGGVESTSAEDTVVAVVVRENGVITGLCTGTAVAPNLVLTARHCVSNTDDHVLCSADGAAVQGAKVRADHAASDLYIYVGSAAKSAMFADSPAAPTVAARGKSLVVEGTTLCNSDLAFLVLDRDLPGPFAPVRTSTAAFVVGESLTAVGYGLTAAGSLPDTRQKRTAVNVLALGRLDFGGGVGLGNAELLVAESSCSGDSGGPLLSPVTGAVVGVVSRGGGGSGPTGNPAASCIGGSAHSIYTHLGPKSDLLTRAQATAGRSIWREGKLNPYGPGGATGAIDPSSERRIDEESDAAQASTDAAASDAHDASPAAAASPQEDPSLPRAASDVSPPAGTNACVFGSASTRSGDGLAFLAFGLFAVLVARRRRPDATLHRRDAT